MANLPENTTYGNTKTSSPLANYSSVMKNLVQSSQKAAGNLYQTPGTSLPTDPAKTISTPSDQKTLFGYNQDVQNALFRPYETLAPTKTEKVTPLGTPLWAQEPTKTQPLPEGYTQFEPAGTKGGRSWVDPTDTTEVRNIPIGMGGGQYLVDPNQPGKWINSSRAIMDMYINPGAKKKVLGTLPSSLYQVDHIIPLWAGGSDTMANLEVYDNITHSQKTVAQSVPLTLLNAGLISPDEARVMVLNWNNNDLSRLPDASVVDSGNGYLPVATAQKIKQGWEDDLAHPNTIPKVLGRMWGDLLGTGESMQTLGKEAADKVSNKYLHGFVDSTVEFGKGIVGGVSAGIIPGTGAREDTGVAGKLTNLAGQMIGMTVGMGWLVKGISKAVAGIRGVTTATAGLNKAKQIAKVGLEIAPSLKKAEAAIDVGKKSASALAWQRGAARMGTGAALMAAWGQLGLQGRVLTGQEEASLSNSVAQFKNDLLFGAVTSIWGQSIRGYVGVASAVTTLGLMEGKSIEESLQDAALMTAFHTMGAKGNFKAGGASTVFSQNLPKALSEQTYKQAISTADQWIPGVLRPLKMGETVPEQVTYDLGKIRQLQETTNQKYPKDTTFSSMGPVTTQVEGLNFLEQLAKKEVLETNALLPERLPQTELVAEFKRISTSFNVLRNRTMLPEAREIQEKRDLKSLAESIPKPKSTLGKVWEAAKPINTSIENAYKNILKPQIIGDTRIAMDSKQALESFSKVIEKKQIPPNLRQEFQGAKFAEGMTTSSGLGKDMKTGQVLDPVSRSNVDSMATDPSKYDGKVYATLDNETIKYFKRLNAEAAWAGKPPVTADPGSTIRLFIKNKATGYESAGYLIDPRRLDPKNVTNVNKVYTEIIAGLRNNIATAKSETDVLTALGKSKAFNGVGNIDPALPQKIWAERAKVLKMTDDQLLAFLNPPNAQYKHTLASDTIANSMRKANISTLVMDINKVDSIRVNELKGGDGNPYFDFKATADDYLRSIAMERGIEAKEIPQEFTKIKKTFVPPVTTSPVNPPISKEILKPGSEGAFNITKFTGKEAPIKEIPVKSEVEKTPVKKSLSKGSIQKLLEESKLTAEEAAPYVEMENKIGELNKAATTRYLTKGEMDLAGKIEREIRLFLEKKDLVKKAIGAVPKGSKYKNVYESKNEGMAAEDTRSMKLSETLEQEKAFEDALLLVEKIRSNKLSRSARKEAHQDLKNLANSMSIKNPFTERKILDLLNPKKNPVSLNNDQLLAEQYGLKLKDGYLELGENYKPVFTKEFIEAHPGAKDKTPTEFWGSFLEADLAANSAYKTAAGERAIKQYKEMEKDPTFGLYAKTINAGIKKIVLDPQSSGLKWLMGNNPGKSYAFNYIMNPGGRYAKNRLFAEKNLQGHFKSQPRERIIAEVEGMSPEQIKKIDRETLAAEEIAAEARASREKSPGEADESMVKMETDLPEGFQAKDLAGMNIADITQSQKIQDLTSFEMRFPSLLYKIETGKNPSKAAVVNDGIAALKEILSAYNKKVGYKPGGKIKKIEMTETETKKWNPTTQRMEATPGGWDAIRKEMLKGL